MDKVLHCECGFEARASHEEGLVEEVRRHAREAHGMALSREQALALASRAGPDEDAVAAGRVDTTAQRDGEEK